MIPVKKIKDIEIIIVLLLAFMPLADILYPAGLENVSRTVPVYYKLALLILLIFYFVTRRKKWWFREPVGKVLTALLFIHLFYLLVTSDSHMTDFYKVSKTLIWFFGFYFFLELGLHRKISQKHINWFFSFIILLLFLKVYQETQNEAFFDANKEFGASNFAYYLLFVMPFMFMDKKVPYKIILFTIITVGVALSFKRGVMLLYAVSILYLLTLGNLQYISGKWGGRIFKTVIIIVIAVVSWEVVLSNIDLYTMKFSDLTQEGMSESGIGIYSAGSGRGALYLLPIERWIYSDPFHFIFGYGFNATPDFYPTTAVLSKGFYAHSDFVMFIHDYGVIGIIILISFFSVVYKEAKDSFRVVNRTPLMLLFIALFIKSAFSGFILYEYSIYAFAILGLIIGRKRRNN